MTFINYFFASVISFLGLVAGIILINIAPEEQKQLKKYFEAIRKILLLLIFIFITIYFYNNIFSILILIAYIVFLFFVEYKMNDMLKKSIISYGMLGIIFFLSFKIQNLFLIESSLIFLYGIPVASLLYSKKEKNSHKILFYNIGFILLANLIYLT